MALIMPTGELFALNLSDSHLQPVGGDPVNEQYKLLEKATQRYEALRNDESWNEIRLASKTILKVNDRESVIKEIKKRLELLGDLQENDHSDLYHSKMEIAVKRFQRRHGFEENGLINSELVRVLNIPLETRISQLRLNMQRILKEAEENPGTHIIANIPEFKLYVYEGNREVLSMNIVVGKTTNQTVVFNDELEQVVFSPYWNIPESIVRNEILPEMNKNSRYLRTHNMEIIGTKNGLPDIRQLPGPKNSLGKVKFLFPNKYNIYFHDTPAKTLFEKRSRAFSHGCIRLSQPFELAKYLLRNDPDWNDTSIESAMNSRKERYVTLEKPVPVAISYYTAWIDGAGDIHFRDDIYGRDKKMITLEE
ncbi:L,D-transpeptidase family protein [Pedobacter sp. P351]|uniref:L,D-transpeptidase family protein n=1 Tax=Pedobacter superstes TaxID=3133441 RepID=UPI0030AFF57E